MRRLPRAPFAIVLVWCSLAFQPTAHAAFPGRNGAITFIKVTSGFARSVWMIDPGTRHDRAARVANVWVDGRATWSPDGNTLLYDARNESTTSIYTYQPGDPEPVLVIERGWHPAWSPDGSQIAFVGSGEGPLLRPDVFVADADGADIVQITNDPACDASPTWSPDGSRIAFTRASEGDGGYIAGMSCGRRSAAPDLYTVAADGSDIATLSASANYGEMEADWSPDGTKLVFQCYLRRDRICIYNIDADRIVEIYSRRDAGSDPVWSPNGRRIAFVVTPRTEEDNDSEIFTMRPDGSRLRQVTDNRQNDLAPDWGLR